MGKVGLQVRCFLWFHKWGPWSAEELHYHGYDHPWLVFTRRFRKTSVFRECRRCGATQTAWVKQDAPLDQEVA